MSHSLCGDGGAINHPGPCLTQNVVFSLSAVLVSGHELPRGHDLVDLYDAGVSHGNDEPQQQCQSNEQDQTHTGVGQNEVPPGPEERPCM